MGTIPARNQPCPECGGTPDIWSDGHAPACRHPRRLLMHPLPPMLIFATVFFKNGTVDWMTGGPGHIANAITVMDMSGTGVRYAEAVDVAGWN